MDEEHQQSEYFVRLENESELTEVLKSGVPVWHENEDKSNTQTSEMEHGFRMEAFMSAPHMKNGFETDGKLCIFQNSMPFLQAKIAETIALCVSHWRTQFTVAGSSFLH